MADTMTARQRAESFAKMVCDMLDIDAPEGLEIVEAFERIQRDQLAALAKDQDVEGMALKIGSFMIAPSSYRSFGDPDPMAEKCREAGRHILALLSAREEATREAIADFFDGVASIHSNPDSIREARDVAKRIRSLDLAAIRKAAQP